MSQSSARSGAFGEEPHPVPLARPYVHAVSTAPSCSTSMHSTIDVDASNPPLAAPGEWICAGYTGEGMVRAWLSGQAVAKMVLGVSEDEETAFGDVPALPAHFLITEKRVKAAKFEDLL